MKKIFLLGIVMAMVTSVALADGGNLSLRNFKCDAAEMGDKAINLKIKTSVERGIKKYEVHVEVQATNTNLSKNHSLVAFTDSDVHITKDQISARLVDSDFLVNQRDRYENYLRGAMVDDSGLLSLSKNTIKSLYPGAEKDPIAAEAAREIDRQYAGFLAIENTTIAVKCIEVK